MVWCAKGEVNGRACCGLCTLVGTSRLATALGAGDVVYHGGGKVSGYREGRRAQSWRRVGA
jgi:hypothetical protein